MPGQPDNRDTPRPHLTPLSGFGNAAAARSARQQMSTSQPPGDADEVVRSAEGGDASITEPPVRCLDDLPEDLLLLVVKSTDTLSLQCVVKEVGKTWCLRALQELHTRLARAFKLIKLASELQGQGRYDEAEPLAREAVELLREKLGDRHPATLTIIANLGVLLYEKRDLWDAEPLLREALVGLREVVGSRHRDTLTCIGSLGAVLRGKGDHASAEPLYREVVERKRDKLGRRHPDTLCAISKLGALLREKAELDWRTLRPLFSEKEISYGYTGKEFVMLAMVELRKMCDRELDDIAHDEPGIFEVFERRGGMRTRDTRVTGTA